MSQRAVDRIIVLALVFMSGSFYVISESFPPGADTFPKVMLGIIFILSLILLGGSFRKKTEEASENVKGNLLIAVRPYLTVFFCAIYVIGVQFIGFFVSTFIFGTILMIYLGVKNYLTILISLISLLVAIYLLFVLELHVPLPQGLLF